MARNYLRMRFTFTHEDDVKAFGSDPWLYDEYKIVALDGRSLAGLDEELGMPVPEVMNAFRANATIGDLGTTWLAMRLALGKEKVVPFTEYSPHTMMIEWDTAPEVEAGKDSDWQEQGLMPEQADPRPASDSISLPSLPRAV